MATSYSASAIVGGTVTRHYVYQIDGYSRTKELPNGTKIQSPTFRVGDYSWRISCYPSGACPSSAGYISVFLELRGGAVARPVKVRPGFGLLDRAGNPVPDHSRYTDLREFSVVGEGYGFGDFIRREFLEASEHLVEDRFRIQCDVTVPARSWTEDRPPPLSDLQRHLGSLLAAGAGADVAFQVAGETFSAHRCVLAARSPVFRAELFGAASGGGGGTTTTTTIGDCIRIDGMPAHVFDALLHFIYTDSLPETTGLEKPMMAEHLLEAADRYGMQRLKLICEDELSGGVNENTVAKMLRLAVRHRCRTLREACIEYLKDPPALDVVMAADDGLLEFVAMRCPVVLKELWAYEDDPIHDELLRCL